MVHVSLNCTPPEALWVQGFVAASLVATALSAFLYMGDGEDSVDDISKGRVIWVALAVGLLSLLYICFGGGTFSCGAWSCIPVSSSRRHT